MPDQFSITLELPHLVVVTERVILETSNPDLTQVVERGIYSFSSFKKARKFTTLVNNDLVDTVAFRFKRETETKLGELTNEHDNDES